MYTFKKKHYRQARMSLHTHRSTYRDSLSLFHHHFLPSYSPFSYHHQSHISEPYRDEEEEPEEEEEEEEEEEADVVPADEEEDDD